MKNPRRPEIDLKQEIVGIFCMAVALLGAVCLFSPSSGLVASIVEKVLRALTGEGRYLFPVLMAFWGIKLLGGAKLGTPFRAWGGLVLFLTALTVIHIVIIPGNGWKEGIEGRGGGMLGAVLYFLCYKSFGMAGTVIIVAAFTLTGILLCINVPLNAAAASFRGAVHRRLTGLRNRLNDFLFVEYAPGDEDAPVIIDHTQNTLTGDINVPPAGGADFADPHKPARNRSAGLPALRLVRTGEFGLESLEGEEQAAGAESGSVVRNQYKLPPLSLFSRPSKNKGIRSNKDITENIKTLEATLENFGVKAKVTQVSRGPAITRYEIHPPPGVKVSRIVGLADDIALSMASPDVRIEAPIPGKAAVGIEVPNTEITMVHLRELLESEEFRSATSKLTVSLGKDIAGNPIVADLTRMPHLLIAGATGSGKSVCLNTMIASILFKATPDEVKVLIIDPKMVELTTYNGIPHLISPVVTDPKKAATALRWAVKEMEYRYELFAAAGVRDIARYNNASGKNEKIEKPLPYIVLIIDELADLMMVAPADVEDSICRLAQMARAAGIHLVIATQRPSVDVITGLIKANIPSRISFAVSSQVDSRTIMDMGGAEKLLGKGDMLFAPVGAAKPIRVQGTYLSDKEVENLVSFWKRQAEPVYDQTIAGELHRSGPGDGFEDELLPRAVEIFIETGHASISLLQRRLHIGYARAARLIDIMERRGIVGGYEGSKPRAVLMTLEQFESTFREPGRKKTFW